MELAWGEVTQVSPTVECRFVGDGTDIPVALKLNSYGTVATNDKVMLARLGTKSGWVMVGKVVASA